MPKMILNLARSQAMRIMRPLRHPNYPIKSEPGELSLYLRIPQIELTKDDDIKMTIQISHSSLTKTLLSQIEFKSGAITQRDMKDLCQHM